MNSGRCPAGNCPVDHTARGDGWPGWRSLQAESPSSNLVPLLVDRDTLPPLVGPMEYTVPGLAGSVKTTLPKWGRLSFRTGWFDVRKRTGSRRSIAGRDEGGPNGSPPLG